jgi:hypothetical protein
MKKRLVSLLCVFAFAVSPLYGQGDNSRNRAPVAEPADVESIEAIMFAVYDVISGGIGEERDWDRMRSLFIDEAQLIPSFTRADGSGNGLRVLTLEQWIEASGPFLTNQGFFEIETHRVIEQFGHMAHVFSTYDSRRNADDPEPFARGINSFQLFNDGTRWWVVSIYWNSETPDLPIPDKYLRS